MAYLNRLLLKGNEAVVYGALLAGCDAFYGYPITPASEVAHSSAKLFPMLHRTFLQAESEISAINMVIGASAAGKPQFPFSVISKTGLSAQAPPANAS